LSGNRYSTPVLLREGDPARLKLGNFFLEAEDFTPLLEPLSGSLEANGLGGRHLTGRADRNLRHRSVQLLPDPRIQTIILQSLLSGPLNRDEEDHPIYLTGEESAPQRNAKSGFYVNRKVDGASGINPDRNVQSSCHDDTIR
jgi:hypothetical protein